MHDVNRSITESMLYGIIDNLTGAILVVDRHRRVMLANKMAELLTGRQQAEILGKRAGEALGCINAHRSPRGCDFDPRCGFCSIKKSIEATIEKRSGSQFLHVEIELDQLGRRHLKASAQYLILDDVEAVLISMEDITEAKEQERLRLENAQLNSAIQTAGAVCHELNQPLSVISGYVQMFLADRSESDPDFDCLSQLQAAAIQIEAITQKLMAINRYRTKRYAGVTQILDLDRSATEKDGERFEPEGLKPPAGKQAGGSMKTIMVIDDDAQVRKTLNAILSRRGFRIVQAENGHAAVKLLETQPADMVITDIFMPEKDGLEIIKELKTLRPELKIIAISGGGRHLNPTLYLHMARTFGAVAILNKPMATETLLQTIDDILDAENLVESMSNTADVERSVRDRF